jgi:ubiquinone/menaquinone biosynthesis C-methylase UbiE
MRKLFTKLANTLDSNSLSTRLRKRRFSLFLEMIKKLENKHKRPLKILDVGGWFKFWEMMEFDKTQHKITVLNIERIESEKENIICVVGDARNMNQFNDLEFDIVFSNSVIEHLQTFENQMTMAEEIKRLSNNYFIQTPSYYFPLEPHFLFPFFHWLPTRIRIFLLTHFH